MLLCTAWHLLASELPDSDVQSLRRTNCRSNGSSDHNIMPELRGTEGVRSVYVGACIGKDLLGDQMLKAAHRARNYLCVG